MVEILVFINSKKEEADRFCYIEVNRTVSKDYRQDFFLFMENGITP